MGRLNLKKLTGFVCTLLVESPCLFISFLNFPELAQTFVIRFKFP